jgi:hypothetical protein
VETELDEPIGDSGDVVPGELPLEGAVPRIDTRQGDGGVTYWEEGDEPIAGIHFVAPLNNWTEILDRFGEPRGENLYHGGIDFSLDTYPNAEIYAACEGWVAGISESVTHSTYIVVKCGDSKWTTVYAHVGEIYVAVNDQVVAGETVIARSGGPTIWGPEMLHFELRWDFVPVDPESWINFNIRPSFTIPPTPTPTATPSPTPEPTPTPAPSSGPSGPGGGGSTPPTSTPPPTATPTAPPTPTPTPWIQPTATPVPPTPTPTRIPTATPTATPTIPPPTPTPTPLPCAS